MLDAASLGLKRPSIKADSRQMDSVSSELEFSSEIVGDV